MSREILTLQFGHYSNFIGTHLWNIQECGFNYGNTNAGTSDIDQDVLYREGRTLEGRTTFTPRLLLVDLKGSLNTLPESGGLDKVVNSAGAENGEPVEIKTYEKPEKNQFQLDLELKQLSEIADTKYDLDDLNCVWSDFLYGRFHKRTIQLVDEYEHKGESSQFDLFPLGANLWKAAAFYEQFCDNIQTYIEECDNFQGFHVILDSADGFGGLAAECMESIQDEYARKPIIAFPAMSTNKQSGNGQTLNVALCYEKLAQVSSLFVPLSTQMDGLRPSGPSRSFNHLLYKPALAYHTSAILASYIDTITLNHRSNCTRSSLLDLCVDMSVCGRKAAAASLCLPFCFNKGDNLLNCLDQWTGPLTRCISPNCELGDAHVTQLYVLRGVSKDRLKVTAQKDLPCYHCQTVEEMLDMYLRCNTFYTCNRVTAIKDRMPVCTPFPQFFDPKVDSNGDVTGDARPTHAVVSSVPVLAGLHSSKEVGSMIGNVHEAASKIKYSNLHRFVAAGLEADEFRNSLDNLFDLRDCYFDNYNV